MRIVPTLLRVAALAAALWSLPLVAADAPAPTPTPTPSLEQRVASLEAYINNSDPAAGLKDAKGNIPSGLTTPTVGVPGPGANAWLMTSSALVLFMTLPGLALFYGGLVRRKNVLSVMAQCLLLSGLVTILWWLCGYSLVFDHGSPFLGKLHFAFLDGVTSAPNPDYAFWVSHNIYAMFQLMFAIITPALIVGAIAERMKFAAIAVFMLLWMFVVYFPQAHMIWGADGLMNGAGNPNAAIKAIDFAGGTVVHMTSGWSALILCIILGKRLGFGKENMAPHSIVLCMVGTGMLWVGWYGFNAGSALGADVNAATAFTNTTLAAAFASFVWPMCEWLTKGKPSVLGFCSGAVGGLVVITPACGYVTANGAVLIGVLAALVPWFFCYKVKGWIGYDDALDTFGVHGVGGTMGALLTGVLARNAANANLATNLKDKVTDFWLQPLVLEQLKAIGLTLVLSVVGTVIVAYLTKILVGLRPSAEDEEEGLDLADHGEPGYHSE